MIFTEKTWEKLIGYGEDLLLALLILIAGLLLTKLVLKVARKVLDKSSLDESVYKFLLKTIKYGLYLLIFVVVLTCLHVPTAPLVTVLGAGGAAIALAMKDSLGNIASGIIILVNQPFIRGDVIEVAGVTGIVQSIDLMVTTLRTYDNNSISIPNGTITASVRCRSHKGQRHPDDRRGILQRCITKSAAVLRYCGAQGQCGRSRLQGLVQDLQILGCKVLPGGTGQTRF